MQHNRWKRAALAAVAGAAIGLAACGGGSGGGGVPFVAKCAPVAGAADAVQAHLATLGTAAGGIPQAGPAAAALADAAVSITDAVDAVAAAVENAALTQDPAAIAAAADQAGERLSCGLDELVVALETLNASALADTPAEALVTQALAQVESLQGLLESDVLSGSTSADLSVVTDPLESLAAQLTGILAHTPVGTLGLPEARLVMAVAAANIANLAVLLDEVGQLDHGGTAAALLNYYSQMASLFSVAGQVNAGPLDSAVALAATQIHTAAGAVVPVLAEGLVMILEPVFDALRAVLGGPAGFEEMVLGLITATPVNGDFAQLIASLSGGGGVPELGNLLAGVPVLGALAAEVLGSSGSPTDALRDILNGAPGMPTLAEVLGQLPDLGGLSPASVAEIQQLVEDLLALNGGGIPVIEDIRQQVGGQFTVRNLDEVTDLLNGLLGGIL